MASSNLKGFTYLPFSNPEAQIRLLSLSWNRTEIHQAKASLEVYAINEAPPYYAVSYAWGTQAVTESLWCDDGTLPTTPHLLSGIKMIRDIYGTVKLWIDAICINQADNVEKSKQIHLMAHIYGKATGVLVWLGEAENESDKVMDLSSSFAEKLRGIETSLLYGDDTYQEIGLPLVNDTIWASIARFWSRSWWHRLWVLQEAILATRVSFICGNRVLDLSVLADFASATYRTGLANHIESSAENRLEVRGHKTLIDMIAHREELRAVGQLNVLKMLAHGRWFRATEPVDRVYALFGVIDRTEMESVTVDYSDEAKTSFWDLYIQVAKVIMTGVGETGGLQILRLAESSYRPSRLPSWVPNWHSQTPTVLLGDHFHAGITEGLAAPNAFHLDCNTLRVSGFIVGNVAETVPLEYRQFKDATELVGFRGTAAFHLGILYDAWELYKKSCSQPEDEMRQRFARTLITDVGPRSSYETTKYPWDVGEDYIWFRRYLLRAAYGKQHQEGSLITEEHIQTNAFRYNANLSSAWRKSCFFATLTGQIGVATAEIRPGDIVAVLRSATCPYVLRQAGKDTYSLIGSAYCDGIMYGEALREHKQEQDIWFSIL